MKTIYAQETFPEQVNKTIFLAGPTPRDEKTPSWRKEAISLLQDLNYDGHVFIPEPRDGNWKGNYSSQVEWEEEGLNRADCIVFWIPRNMENLPGLTTNDEFGNWKNSGKVVLGCPKDAVRVNYQIYYANKLNIPFFHSLKETLQSALDLIKDGSERTSSETFIPLHVWQHSTFQKWLNAHKNVGNLLTKAKVLYNFWAPKDKILFAWILQANIWIPEEKRIKSNEFVFGRTDTTSCFLYKKDENVLNTKIILVKEFRTPVRNKECFVYELPGGSSKNNQEEAIKVISSEILEEVGLDLDLKRFKLLNSRQLLAALLAHESTLFCVELTQEELDFVEKFGYIPKGVEKDTERTYSKIYTIKELLDSNLIDWSTLGMIFQGINNI